MVYRDTISKPYLYGNVVKECHVCSFACSYIVVNMSICSLFNARPLE